MVYEKARMYAYLSAEITSLYHEAAVKIGISDTVLNILYVLCEKEGQCLQRDIFRLTGISRQTINSAIRKLERDGIAYLKQGEGRNTMVCLTKKREQLFHRKKFSRYFKSKIRYGMSGQPRSRRSIFC
ncbi:MAG: helix-turn-helix transcriptional regulator [Evtepia gabavorous]